ncbi:hypothetical protein K491DRAFT_574461, partial [Lophiostoma macrostomum CBS 122681]
MHSRQPELYCAALIPYTAAAVALGLRLLARHKTNVRLEWEDYLSIVSFLFGTVYTAFALYKMRWGFGLSMSTIPMPVNEIERKFFREQWIDMWFYTFSLGLSKFVILGLYWRLFSRSIIRQPVRILAGLNSCWILLRVILALLLCQPISKAWNPDIPDICSISPTFFLFATLIPHLLIEIGCVICPMVVIKTLQLRQNQKIAVGAMFASGFLVCASVLHSLIYTVTLNPKSPDLSLDGANVQIWSVCDVNLAHFSTSLPLLRPALQSFGGFFSTMFSTSLRSTA